MTCRARAAFQKPGRYFHVVAVVPQSPISRPPPADTMSAGARTIETLEGRQLLSTFAVTNTLDSGSGSLRQAIINSNATKGPNSISFNISGTGVHTINLLSACRHSHSL